MDRPPTADHSATPAAAKSGKRAVQNDATDALLAAAKARRSCLAARQGDLQILLNTKRLLVKRGGIAEATLRQVHAHRTACHPAAPPLPFDDADVTREAGQLTAHVQRRMFSASEAPPAPGLSRFKAHCGICMDALTRMQGSSAELDTSEKNLRVLMDEFRARVAEAAGLREEDICWYLVTTWEAAPGVQLSFGLGLTTPACIASLMTYYFLIQVQCALLLEEIDAMRVSDDSASSGSEAGARGEAPQPHPSSRYGDARQAPHAWPPPPAGPPNAAAPNIAPHAEHTQDGTAAPSINRVPPDIHESTTRPPDHSTGSRPAFVQAGVPRGGGCAAAAAGVGGGLGLGLVEGIGESVGSDAGPRDSGGAAAFRGEWYEGTVADSGAGEEPQLRCGLGGTMPLASTVAALVEAIVQRFEHRVPRRRIVDVLETMLPALGGGEGGGDGGTGGQGGAQEGAAPAAMDPAGAAEPVQDSPLKEHHVEGLIAATQAMQQAVVNMLYRLSQGEEQPWHQATGEHERDMLEVQRHMLDFTVGLAGLTMSCTHAYLTLSLQVALPGDTDFCEVENMQVRLYKALRVSQSQKPLLAAVWAYWTRNRSMLSLSLSEAQLPMSIWSPHSTDLPPTLDALATVVATHGSTFRLRKLPEDSHVPHVPPLGFFAPLMHGDGGADTAETLPRRRFCAADGRLLLDSPAAWVLSQELAAASPGLLGQCPVATIAAAETLRRLRAMQSMSLRVSQDVQAMPVLGDALTPLQQMQTFWLPVVHGYGCVDYLALCRLAYQQVHQDELFARIEALAI